MANPRPPATWVAIASAVGGIISVCLAGVRAYQEQRMDLLTGSLLVIGSGAIGVCVVFAIRDKRAIDEAAIEKARDAALVLCTKCRERVPEWFAEKIPTIGLLCLHCETSGRFPYPIPDQTEDGYLCLQQQLQPPELEQCPVCKRTVPRGEMQRASVKYPTNPGKSHHVKQFVCNDCIASGAPLVAGARAQKGSDGST
jgi:hypothetical protein